MEFQAIVMAAGTGSRMTDLTAKTPKALLPVGNMPMVWYPINMLEKAGFEEATIVVLESCMEDIRKALIDICDVKMRLDFVTINDTADWGTAESLRYLKEKDKIKADILVVSCDLITDIQLHLLADIHRTHDATVTTLMTPMTDNYNDMIAPGTKSKRKMIEKDIVGLDANGRRLLLLGSEADFDEVLTVRKSLLKKHPCMNIRSRLLDGHLYLMKKWVVDFLAQQKSITTIRGELIPYLVRKQFSKPKNAKDLPAPDASMISVDTNPGSDIYSFCAEDKLSKLIRETSSWNDHHGDMESCYHGNKIRCYAYINDNAFCIRANTVATYCEANRQVVKQWSSLAPNKELRLVDPAATIQGKSQVGADSMVAAGVTIGEKVSVKKSIIGRHCKINEKVKIANSIVMDHVTIKEGCNLQNCVVCENVHINERCDLKDCLIGSHQNILAMGKFSSETIMDTERMMEI